MNTEQQQQTYSFMQLVQSKSNQHSVPKSSTLTHIDNC